MRDTPDPSADLQSSLASTTVMEVESTAPASLAVARPTGDDRFLSQVSDLLNSSLDYRATIQSVARLCAGYIAEYCIVHVEDAGEIRALGIAHTDISREAGLREILRLLPIGISSRNPLVHVIRSGEAMVMTDIGDAELAALTGSSPHGEALRELGLSSAIMFPLTARGNTLGAISLARSGAAPPYAESDLALVTELARRAALAVDNARLYREARREANARERTLGVVSHDLRNALNAALLHSEMLIDLTAEQLGSGMGRKQMFGLRRSLEHMQRLVQDLLDVESIESGRLSLHLNPLDFRLLHGEIEELFTPLADERGITFEVSLAGIQAVVLADHIRIVQALINLVTNAVQFTPSGGIIRVSGEVEGDSVHFRVTDTGSGIAEADLPHVFERHWRGVAHDRRLAGSGLGLTIVRGIVQAHGGESWVESAIGAGATFYFTLPIET